MKKKIAGVLELARAPSVEQRGRREAKCGVLWNNVMIKIGRILLAGRSLECGRIAGEGLQKPEGNVWHKQRTNEEGLHVQRED